jgi:hypothetical protein
VWLPPREIRDLRRLVRYRQQLVERRKDIKLRMRAMLRDDYPSGRPTARFPNATKKVMSQRINSYSVCFARRYHS